MTNPLQRGILNPTEKRFGKPAERPGREVRCPNGSIPHDRPTATDTRKCVQLQSAFYLPKRAFRKKPLFFPPYDRDVHTPHRRRPPAGGGRLSPACTQGARQADASRMRRKAPTGCVRGGETNIKHTRRPRSHGLRVCFSAASDGCGQKKSAKRRKVRLTARPEFDIMKRLYWEDGRKHVPTLICP